MFSASPSIGFTTTRSFDKCLGTDRDFLFDFLIEAGKEFAHRSLENNLTRQGGLQTRLAIKLLVTAHLCSAFGSQQKCHFALGKSQAFSI